MVKKKLRNKKKKLIKLKTHDDRKKEIENIVGKLSSLGISSEFDFMNEFKNISDKYIEKGESWSGSIKMTGLKRIMNIILTTKKHLECSLTLKYDENV